MSIEDLNNQRFSFVVGIAAEHASGEGFHSDIRWLSEAFNEYFLWHEEQVKEGLLLSFGETSSVSRNVCAGKIARAVRFSHGADEQQCRKLSASLGRIVSSDYLRTISISVRNRKRKKTFAL